MGTTKLAVTDVANFKTGMGIELHMLIRVVVLDLYRI